MAPRVAIIIVVWNGKADTVECLQSLAEDRYPNKEIVIVDNGSSDGTADDVRRDFPTATVIETGANLGFTGGNNVGIRHALGNGADYVYLLNNDTTVEPDALQALVDAAEADPSVGLLAPIIYEYYPPRKIWFAGSRMDLPRGAAWHDNSHVPDRSEAPSELPWATGCAMLIPAPLMRDELHGFDDRYYLSWEDVDLCVRARKAGRKVMAVPNAIIYHKGGQSGLRMTGIRNYYAVRNSLLLIRKHAGAAYYHSAPRLVRRFLWQSFRAREGFRVRYECTRSVFDAVLDHLLQRYGPYRSAIVKTETAPAPAVAPANFRKTGFVLAGGPAPRRSSEVSEDMLKVSVVIPCYNYACFLKEAIDSVLSQTHPAHEVIVVDDGSSDETESVAKSFGGRIQYIRTANRGVSAARNTGVKAATGDLIAIFDADDRWLPEKLERQVAMFEADPSLGLVHTRSRVFDGASGETNCEPPTQEDYSFHGLLSNCSVSSPSAVVPRAVFEKIGGFDEKLSNAADWNMWLRIAAEYKVACCPEVLVEYREHDNSMSHKDEGKQFRECLVVIDQGAKTHRGCFQCWKAAWTARIRHGALYFHNCAAGARIYDRQGNRWKGFTRRLRPFRQFPYLFFAIPQILRIWLKLRVDYERAKAAHEAGIVRPITRVQKVTPPPA